MNWVLRQGGPFNRVFVDEFHDANEGVKERIELVWSMVVQGLRALSAQVLLLTATMPPHLVHMYQQLLQRNDFNIIRESSDRPNLAYHFLPGYQPAHREHYHYEDIVQDLIVSLCDRIATSTRPRDRILVFFSNLPSVKSFADAHGYLMHHSGRSKEELKDTLSRWDSGHCPVIVSTTAMAQGFDRRDVRYTIVANVLYGMTLLSQMMGRCGRDGLQGEMFFIGPPGTDDHAPDHWDLKSADAQKLLNTIKTCQRYFTIKHMDGAQFAYSCITPPNLIPVNPCGNCAPESELHTLGLMSVATAAQRYHSNTAGYVPAPSVSGRVLVPSSSTDTSSSISSFKVYPDASTSGTSLEAARIEVSPFLSSRIRHLYILKGLSL